MPPRRPGPAGGGPQGQSGRSGVRIDTGLQFQFRPSIGLSARNIDKLGINIRSFREPLKRSIQQVIAPSFRKNFQVGGRPQRWRPLAEYTVEERGNSKPILVRSGMLMRTMQQFNIWTVDTQKAALLDLPPKIWYGKIHQAGYGARGSGQIKAAGIPARPFAIIQTADFEKIDRVFVQWLKERMEQHNAFRADR